MAQTNQISSLRRAVDAILRGEKNIDLDTFLRERRAAGESYEMIARALNLMTDGAITVSYQTISRWVGDLEEVA